MDFSLNEDQRMMAEAVGRMLAEVGQPSRLRALLDAGEQFDADRWSAIVEMGLPGLLAPEAVGGAGLGRIEMALVAQAAGMAILPEPLVEHAGVAVPILAAASVLPADALTGSIVAVGHPAHRGVLGADKAAHLLLPAADGYHLIPRDAADLHPLTSIDPFRRVSDVSWTARSSTHVADTASLDRALDLGALFAAAQLIGIAQKAVDLAVAYAADRAQFGKPIGSFQAVKHLLANAQVKIEFARPVVHAAAAMEDGPLARARISHAKLAATAAADAATHAAVQVHGAMGFSWEVDAHLLLKRSLALGQTWGTPALHRQRIAAHLASAPIGVDQTFAGANLEEARSVAA